MSGQTKFDIIHNEINDIDLLYLNGFLDAHTAPILETKIGDLLESGNFKIIIVLRDLDYISSAGLGVFMAFIEDIREKGGDIKIANMKPKVFSVFDLLGFPMLFDIFDDEKLAMEKFNHHISDCNNDN